jgi:hypothetical protein
LASLTQCRDVDEPLGDHEVDQPACAHEKGACRGDRLSDQEPPRKHQERLRPRAEPDRVASQHPGAVRREVAMDGGKEAADERNYHPNSD